jgi:glycine/D-amino acid oxidase-like deaminating enzyme
MAVNIAAKTYDWIVIGAGLAGSALSYELAKVGYSVLLLEEAAALQGATRYSYGGIAYWSATTPLMQTLCREAIALYPHLSAELDSPIQFREIDLLLTIPPGRDPDQVLTNYQGVMIPPVLLSPAAACTLEPLLNPAAIAAALLLRHGHVSPEAMVKAYNQAFLNRGGTQEVALVTGISPGKVVTPSTTYAAGQIVVCAGNMSRALLKQAGYSVRLYYTQAEIIETPPLDLRLNALVMPAELQRFAMEAQATQDDRAWDSPGQELVPPILDVGVVQFQDGSVRIGQYTRAVTDLSPQVDAVTSEAAIRSGIGDILPALRDVPGQWRQCAVAFSGDRLPLVGAISQAPGLYLFSGFSNPFAILPPLARRFAQQGKQDDILDQLSPGRFSD